VQQPRQNEEADDRDRDHEQHDLAECYREIAPGDGAGAREAREQDEHHHHGQVLHHEDAEDDAGKLGARLAEIHQRFEDDGRGADREDGADEQAIHRAPSGQSPNRIAEPQDQRHLKRSGDQCDAANATHAPQARLGTDREQQQDDAELRQCLHRFSIVNQRERPCPRSDQHSGEDVPEDDRLSQSMEERGDRAADGQYQSEITK
jgi:hypothetical protein